MKRFVDVYHAYTTAFEILDVYKTAAGASNFDCDFLGGVSSGGVSNVVNIAIDIQAIADEYDPGVKVRRGFLTDRSDSWFERYFISREQNSSFLRRHEKAMLRTAICAFCRELHKKGLIISIECFPCNIKKHLT